MYTFSVGLYGRLTRALNDASSLCLSSARRVIKQFPAAGKALYLICETNKSGRRLLNCHLYVRCCGGNSRQTPNACSNGWRGGIDFSLSAAFDGR